MAFERCRMLHSQATRHTRSLSKLILCHSKIVCRLRLDDIKCNALLVMCGRIDNLHQISPPACSNLQREITWLFVIGSTKTLKSERDIASMARASVNWLPSESKRFAFKATDGIRFSDLHSLFFDHLKPKCLACVDSFVASLCRFACTSYVQLVGKNEGIFIRRNGNTFDMKLEVYTVKAATPTYLHELSSLPRFAGAKWHTFLRIQLYSIFSAIL